jgi:diaminopimelate decarboxylase
MHLFRYRKGELHAEDVPLRDLAERYGTPLYVYSRGTLLRHLAAYEEAFKGVEHVTCFAVKANSSLAVLNVLGRHGAGADVVSGGELFRALRAGIDPRKVVYAGVGKTEAEIRAALKAGILMFNIESEEELGEINRVAALMRKKAPIALRVNPDIDPGTHPYISTGLRTHKFGIPMEDALEFYRLASGLKHVRVMGVHKHIGSQITQLSPFVDALKRVLLLVDRLREAGLSLTHIDIGGGLGIPYMGEKTPAPRELAARILPLLRGRDITLVAEPGRSIAGNAGVLLTRTLYVKEGAEKTFFVVDGGMNDLMRPTLYGAYHEILPVRKTRARRALADVVGPICETGDFLARDRELPRVSRGDLLAVMSAGAYGFTMSSNYNSRPRAAEVMVRGNRHFLIRARETYDDIIRGERIPAGLG